MKKLFYIFILLLPGFVFGNKENGDDRNLRGVVSTSDGYPAAYVTVEIKNIGKKTITDEHGNFEFKKIQPGIYKLLISLVGYSGREVTTEVKDGGTAFVRIQLEQTYAELQKVTVEAHLQKYVETKPSQSLHLDVPLIEVPQNITVVSNRLLSDQGLVSMTEAIRNVSGLTKYYGTLNDYSLNIRGMNATYSVFRNGVGGYWWNQQEDVAMLEKIEFMKGPAGFIVSMAEPGGIVNNVTKQPTKERVAGLSAGFGSFDFMRLTADFGGVLTKNGKLSYRFNAGAEKQERAFQFSKAKKYFVCPVLKYEFNKNTSVTAEYNFMYGKTSGNNDGVPGVNGEMFVLPRNFAVADAATDAITAIDHYYRLYFQHDFNERWHLNIQLASVHGPWNGDQLVSDVSNPVSNDTLYRIPSFQHYINYANPAYAFIDGKFQTGRKVEHKVLLGIDYNNLGSKGSAVSTWGEKKFGLYIPNPDYFVNPDSLRNFHIPPGGHFSIKWLAPYFQDHIKIAGKLVLTLAGRLTHASTNFEREDGGRTRHNVFTPRAGLTWPFDDNVSAYALYDQCFVAQGARSFDSSTFKPLTGFNIETGLKSYYFNKKLNMNFSIFHIERNNSLTQDPCIPGILFQEDKLSVKELILI